MVKETYSVTLVKEVVDEAKELAKPYGGKLSPIINNLLELWIKQTKRKLKDA